MRTKLAMMLPVAAPMVLTPYRADTCRRSTTSWLSSGSVIPMSAVGMPISARHTLNCATSRDSSGAVGEPDSER